MSASKSVVLSLTPTGSLVALLAILATGGFEPFAFAQQPELVSEFPPGNIAPECAAGRPHERKTIWDRARTPELTRYCQLLARCYEHLPTEPALSLQLAELGIALVPNGQSAWIARAMSHVALGALDLSADDFQHALNLDPSSLARAEVARDYANVLARLGRLPEALETYRALSVRISTGESSQLRTRILLEHASVAMALSFDGAREALVVLSGAQRLAVSDLTASTIELRALALDRAAQPDQARAALRAVSSTELESDANNLLRTAPNWLGSSSEALALAGLIFEYLGSPRAADAWKAYLAAHKADSFTGFAQVHAASSSRSKLGAPPHQPTVRSRVR